MFIDLKNGSCINKDQVLGAKFGKQSGIYVVNITLKPPNLTNQVNIANALKPASINIEFENLVEANKYIEKYFNLESYFE